MATIWCASLFLTLPQSVNKRTTPFTMREAATLQGVILRCCQKLGLKSWHTASFEQNVTWACFNILETMLLNVFRKYLNKQFINIKSWLGFDVCTILTVRNLRKTYPSVAKHNLLHFDLNLTCVFKKALTLLLFMSDTTSPAQHPSGHTTFSVTFDDLCSSECVLWGQCCRAWLW